MSDEWDVHLTYSEGSSNKFWRARVDGTRLFINYGRIGSNGQTQIKDFDSAEESEKERDKVAKSKRKKGYSDVEGAEKPAEAAPAAAPAGPQIADLALDSGGRKVDLRLSCDGDSVRTVVVEKHADAKAAAGAFARLKEALDAEGYTAVKRKDL